MVDEELWRSPGGEISDEHAHMACRELARAKRREVMGIGMAVRRGGHEWLGLGLPGTDGWKSN